MDQLIEDVIYNFDAQLDLYLKKDPTCLFLILFKRKNMIQHGVVKTHDNSTVIGNKKGSFIHGYCIVKYPNNTCYIGDLLESMRDGFGYRSYTITELIYAGYYVKDKKCGKGKLWCIKLKKWVFEGNWDRDMKNGYGELLRDTTIYKGNWVDDKMEGIGRMEWLDGQRYEGEYHQDLRHGKGTMVYSNGDSYTGTFRNGMPHGSGFYEWKNGEIYEGNWTDGIMDGPGTIEYQLPVCAKGSFNMGSLNEINFGLQTESEWESSLAQSSVSLKSFHSQISPGSLPLLEQLKREKENVNPRNQNVPFNSDLKKPQLSTQELLDSGVQIHAGTPREILSDREVLNPEFRGEPEGLDQKVINLIKSDVKDVNLNPNVKNLTLTDKNNPPLTENQKEKFIV